MGGCGSKEPETKTSKPAPKGKPNQHSSKGHPDFGLDETHDLVKFLGKGGHGEIWLFKDKASGEEVAIKLIKRPIPKLVMPDILREIKVQAELGEGHLNLITAKEVLLTRSHLALSLELAAGGSMTSYVGDKLQNAGPTELVLSEDEARYFMRQFIPAVEYCHSHSVAHRDLKLDNTLLDGSHPPLLKLCDFGFAKKWEGAGDMYTYIGTPVYMSPELIGNREDTKGYDGRLVDVWASGILLIVMLLGDFPFDHTEHPDPTSSEAHLEVWQQQVSSQWSDMPRIGQAVQQLSRECMDLLNKIFVVDEKTRISIQGIKEHPWYNKPLSPEYQKALERIAKEQYQIDSHQQSRRVNDELLAERNKQLVSMMAQAEKRGVTKEGSPSGVLMRINLQERPVTERVQPGSRGAGERVSLDFSRQANGGAEHLPEVREEE